MNNLFAGSVDDAITSRHSVRAFRADPVPRALIEHLLTVAARSPSATNMQPWRVHVLTGSARDRLVAAVCHAHDHEPALHTPEFDFYPQEMFDPYLTRRRELGHAMYSLLGIGKDDREGSRQQMRRNYEFFGAPVGLMFSIHRDLALGSWIDCGIFLQSFMVAARGQGLDTCAQGMWNRFHRVIAQELDFAPEESLVCGMALGYADTSAPVNRLQTERAAIASFTTFHE